ncbi:ferredoxin reductase [Hydrocarboniphaga sp.]|uniref:ferredoxin reductase n=1 Tax=Hydrocarboniphaga sp. TaxID=2033016 RepID=UPI003D10BDF2
MNTSGESPPVAARSLWSRIEAITDYFAFPLRTSHYVELVNPLWARHALQARVEKVWDETRDARTITLRPGVNWRGHRAGQHARLGVPIAGMHYTRTYTISSAPERDDRCITITVKAIAGGRMSHHLVRQIKVGDYLPLGLPQGDFYLPDAQPVRPLFITAGSGITPAMSMLRALIAEERLPDSVHIHYAPHEFDVIFGQELRAMAAQHPRYKLQLQLTREIGHQARAGRHFSAEQLNELCPDWRDRDVYACGPPSLLQSLEDHWAQAGLSRRLHVERFRAAYADLPPDAVGGLVRFGKSKIAVQADHLTPLLRVAEDAGMNPPHGCRMGICHTCNTRLLSGCVRDMRTGKLLNETGAIVQTCICAAAGDCELDL